MNVLCVCSRGKNRSRYLAEYLKRFGYETDFCGVSGDAEVPCTVEKVEKADLIVCVRPKHARALLERFGVGKPLLILRVRDTPRAVVESLERKGMYSELRALREQVYENLRREIRKFIPLEDYVREWNS